MQQQPKQSAHPWRRRLVRLAAFCLLALAMVAFIDQVLWDKGGTILGFYEEPRDTIDVLFIGGSHANAAFAPTQMYERQGFTGYVLYSWSQPVWTGYHYLKEGLKTQKPKVVVLDAFGLTYGHTYMTDIQINSTSDQYSMLIRPGYNRLRLALAMSACQTNHRPFTDYFSLFQFHNRWKALKKEDWLWFLQDYSTTGKGYGPLYTTESFPEQVMPADTPENALMEEPCEKYLRRFFALAKEEGFELVVAALPYECTVDEYGIYAKTARLCAENGVPFLNYFDPATAAEAGFNWADDMAEHAHVNYKGAKKISAHIADWLAARYDLPDHRQEEAYAAWDAAAAAENADLARMDLRMTADLAGILQKVQKAGYLTLLASRGQPQQEGLGEIWAALEGAGLDTAALSTDTPGVGLWLLGPGGPQEQLQGPMGETLTLERTLAGETGQSVELAAEANGSALSIRLGGEELALERDGVSVVVVDPATGQLVQNICFDAQDAYAPYTD